MHYEVSAAFKLGSSKLTPAQRYSSHFAPEPRLGVYPLRRGRVLKLEEPQFNLLIPQVRALLKAEAIEVFKVDDSGRYPVRLLGLEVAPIGQQVEEKAEETESTTEIPVEPTPPLVTPESADPEIEVKPVESQEEVAPTTVESADPQADVQAEQTQEETKGRRKRSKKE